jgi:hypothetical protein
MSHCETCGCKLHHGRRGGLAHYGSFEACTRIRLLRAALMDVVANCLGCMGGGRVPDYDLPPGETKPCIVCAQARAALAACVPPEPGK